MIQVLFLPKSLKLCFLICISDCNLTIHCPVPFFLPLSSPLESVHSLIHNPSPSSHPHFLLGKQNCLLCCSAPIPLVSPHAYSNRQSVSLLKANIFIFHRFFVSPAIFLKSCRFLWHFLYKRQLYKASNNCTNTS